MRFVPGVLALNHEGAPLYQLSYNVIFVPALGISRSTSLGLSSYRPRSLAADGFCYRWPALLTFARGAGSASERKTHILAILEMCQGWPRWPIKRRDKTSAPRAPGKGNFPAQLETSVRRKNHILKVTYRSHVSKSRDYLRSVYFSPATEITASMF